MEADLEAPLDQLGGPGGTPQLGPPPVGLGPFQQQGFEFPQLIGGEPRRGPGVRLGGQLLRGASGALHPGIDRRPPASQEVGDVVGRLVLLDELNGPEAAALEFFGGPNRSHTIIMNRSVSLFD